MEEQRANTLPRNIKSCRWSRLPGSQGQGAAATVTTHQSPKFKFRIEVTQVEGEIGRRINREKMEEEGVEKEE